MLSGAEVAKAIYAWGIGTRQAPENFASTPSPAPARKSLELTEFEEIAMLDAWGDWEDATKEEVEAAKRLPSM